MFLILNQVLHGKPAASGNCNVVLPATLFVKASQTNILYTDVQFILLTADPTQTSQTSSFFWIQEVPGEPVVQVPLRMNWLQYSFCQGLRLYNGFQPTI